MLFVVEACVDGKKAGVHGNFTRISDDATTCKELLLKCLKSQASSYSPLHVSTSVDMMCVELGEALQAIYANDASSFRITQFFVLPCYDGHGRGHYETLHASC